MSGSREILGRYVEVKGVRTYYESAGDGSGMLCIHTAGRDCRQWQHYLEYYSDRYRVVALDMPGHQKSWPLSGHACISDREAFADFVWSFKEAIGLEHPILMGCAVGGNIVFLLAQQHPGEVKALVSFAGANFTPPVAPSVLLRHPQISLGDYLYDRNAQLIGRRTAAAVREFILWNVRQVTPEAQEADMAVYANFDVRADMNRITCPSLLVRGSDDWLVSQAMVEAAASRLIRAPVVKLVNIREAGHYVHQEFPGECCGVIDQFLQEIEAGARG